MKRSIIVTGGTRGIGRAVINLFADKGFDVVTCARSEADLAGLQAEMNTKYPEVTINYMVVDLSVREEIYRFVELDRKSVV